jgi:hypothetical protein
MIRAVTRWIRQVLPPDWAVGAFFLVYAASLAPYLIEVWRRGPNFANTDALVLRDAVLIVCALGYGAFRVAALHPLYRPDYHAWLAATPWTREKPLPLGPVHLVPQDGLVVAALWGLMHVPLAPRLLLPLLFMLAYLFTLATALALADRYWHAYLMFFGMGLAVRVIGTPVSCGLALAAVYLVGYAGLRRSLLDFPWPRVEKMNETLQRVNRGMVSPDLLGWPYDQLTPKATPLGIAYRHGIAISLLAGWWVYVLASLFPARAAAPLISVPIVLTLIGCIGGRVGVYCSHRSSPINLWGRLWTLRWIIPSYDQVFIAPLLTPISLYACGWLTLRFELPYEIGFGLAEAVMLLITLNLGPRLAVWHLTSRHRLKPTLNSAAARELIKL